VTTTVAAAATVGNPAANIGIFAVFVVITLFVVHPGQPQQQDRRSVLHRGPGLHRTAERYRDRRRLPVGSELPRHCRRHRRLRLRRLPLLHRLPGAWLVALLLVAELLRNTGRFTMADVLSFRLRQHRSGWLQPRPP